MCDQNKINDWRQKKKNKLRSNPQDGKYRTQIITGSRKKEDKCEDRYDAYGLGGCGERKLKTSKQTNKTQQFLKDDKLFFGHDCQWCMWVQMSIRSL